MKIILLADPHLNYKGQVAHDGYDSNAQFLKILENLKKEEFDHLIILGDTCYEEGEFEIYDWFFDEIEKLNTPFDIISGNHDNPELIIQILDLPTVHTYDKQIFYAKEIGGRSALFLDTTDGVINGQQEKWLKEKLLTNTEDLLIFMHHPPCNAGIPFMDSQHYLKNRKQLLPLLKSQDYRIDVFSGHYHSDKDLQFDNCHIHICPSPYFTINEEIIDFVMDDRTPCYKVLELEGDELKLNSVYL